MAFRFKQFIVEDDKSTMKIGTDAILLGAWADPLRVKFILEIGTGCGVISLMLAQRSNALIYSIDIDEESVNQAKINFRQSAWNERLFPLMTSFQEFVPVSLQKYDLVITNPPFFIDSLPSHDKKKNLAKHSTQMNRHELVDGIKQILDEDGMFYIILPAEESRKFSTNAEKEGLFIQQQMKVRSKAGKPVNRVLSEFGFRPCVSPSSFEMVIRNENNTFTKEYVTFTEPYYFSLC